jgi:F-type H+-transporting ATPase subunit b
MISINLTIILEMILFLAFLAGANRLAWQPLLRLVARRKAKAETDRREAEQGLTVAQRFRDDYRKKLAEADRQAAHLISETTYYAHRDRRNLIAELKIQADMELAAYHDSVQREVETQRRRFPELLPGLIEAMDHQMTTGGRLL